MREILFKGKCVDCGEWVEGCYIRDVSRDKSVELSKFAHRIQPMLPQAFAHPVDPDTICQYTGLTDKNGRKIWENDAVFVTDDDGCSGQIDTGVGVIEFLEGLWYISGSVQNSLYDIDRCLQIEVIGNVFDSPELSEKAR